MAGQSGLAFGTRPVRHYQRNVKEFEPLAFNPFAGSAAHDWNWLLV